MRPVNETEVFPNRDLSVTTSQIMSVFDLSFYPNEKGPYNYDVDGKDPDW
jgi:cell surface protein SprA